MPSHTAAEAVDAVWTGLCDRHEAPPDHCGAREDYRAYDEEYEGIETWYLGA